MANNRCGKSVGIHIPATRPLVIYATKYGSTAEYAAAIAKVLGAVAMRAEKVLDRDFKGVDPVILGSPIYGPSVLPEMNDFVIRYGGTLKEKSLAAFVVCGDTLWLPKAGEGGHRNLAKITDLLPHPTIARAVFGGRMRMADLDNEDRPRIEAFYRRLGKEALGFDRMDLEGAREWGREIKRRYLG